ncbi:MAG: hypothetical protein HW390_2188 [Candidatus Brocadiaceae bacterium]|nr:hypothetical protein [Candidatus Brocadiaceae bacterium]
MWSVPYLRNAFPHFPCLIKVCLTGRRGKDVQPSIHFKLTIGLNISLSSEELLRSTTSPKGSKYIARGEAPGQETKDNQPRRGDRKGRIAWLGCLFFLKCIIVLITKTKHPASPSGLVFFYCL